MKLSPGLVGTKALSFATISRDSVFLAGKMDRGMRGFGTTIYSTALAYLRATITRTIKVSGLTGLWKVSAGTGFLKG